MSDSKKRRCLRIAGCGIAIESDQAFSVEEGYEPFLTADDMDCSISIQCLSGLANAPFPNCMASYQASDEEGKLWEIFESEGHLIIKVYRPEEPHDLQQACQVSSNYKYWKVWSESELYKGEEVLNPLAYPLGPLIMYHLSLIEECIMIHASGVALNGKGNIFTGVSGKGKTTMARLWFESGAKVLNDDRLIIRRIGNDYEIHNTPMFYADEPRKAKLDAIHIIHHAKQNSMRKLGGAEAVSAVMANCIQHGYRKETIDSHLAFLTEMKETVPVYEVGFLPDTSIVDLLVNEAVD